MEGRVYIDGQLVVAKSYFDLQADDTEWAIRAVFDEQKRRGIHQSEFDDKTWRITNGHDHRYIRFEKVKSVPQGYSMQEYVIKLKMYATILLDRKNFISVSRILAQIINACNLIFSGTIPDLINQELVLILRDFETQSGIAIDVSIPGDEGDEDNSSRELATSVVTYYKLDKLVSRFWREADDADKVEYGPIYLYWRYASIIPTRPTEFCMLPKDCIREDEGGFYLLVPKTYIKGQDKPIYNNYKMDAPIVDIHISDELVDRFLEYQKLIDNVVGDFKTEFFFTNAATNKLFNRRAEMSFCRSHFYRLLDRFYEKIVIKKYGYGLIDYDSAINIITTLDKKIELVRLGDLRHLAIRSMFCLGIDPAVIMALAGHDKLATTLGYGNNINNLSNDLMSLCRLRYEKEVEQEFCSTLIETDSVRKPVPDGFCVACDEQKDKQCYLHTTCSDGCVYFRADDNRVIDELKERKKTEIQEACDMLRRISIEEHGDEFLKIIKEIQDRMSQYSWLEVLYGTTV